MTARTSTTLISHPWVSPSRQRLMRLHARRVVAMSAACNGRSQALTTLIGTRNRLRALDHYPPDDVIDRASGAQCFLHTHDEASHGFAHFHSFVRLPGANFGLSERRVTTHIAAVVVDRHGRPVKLIAVNQWVTGEYWQSARRTLALLAHFQFNARAPQAAAGRWLASLLHVFWPELQALLRRRDATLRALLERTPGKNVLQDRRKEILAAIPIDLDRRLAYLAASDGHFESAARMNPGRSRSQRAATSRLKFR